jgi:hypothetical protein
MIGTYDPCAKFTGWRTNFRPVFYLVSFVGADERPGGWLTSKASP